MMESKRDDYRIAVYIRLSAADEDTGKGKDESDSIVNQRSLIHRFLDGHPELSKYPRTEFVDDGYSGTDMDRPAFQRMVAALREGRCKAAIAKDLSRYARDYIEMGDYLERLFPSLGVRCIAINDGYDSDDYKGTTGDIGVVMKAIVYDAYSKDISLKEVTGKRQSRKKGRRATGLPPFGYMPDPERKAMDVIDPEAAPIVRRIFDMALEGKGSGEIARALASEGIPTPSAYYRAKHPDTKKYIHTSEKQAWGSQAVLSILRRFSYTGASVGNLRKMPVPCGKSSFKTKKDEWIVVPDMHEAIVSVEEYEKVQESFKGKERGTKKEMKYPLKSLVFCGGCGRRMAKATGCSFYRCQYGSKEKACKTLRSPKEAEMEKTVLEEIKKRMEAVNAKGKSRKNAAKLFQKTKTADEERLSALRNRASFLKQRKLEEYERYCDGLADKETYLRQKAEISRELSECEKAMSETEEKLAEAFLSQGIRSEAEAVCGAFKGEEKLTYDMAHAFVEKLVVKPEGGLEIVWRFKDVFQDDGEESDE